jgi:acyl-CoA thioesterase FadM
MSRVQIDMPDKFAFTTHIKVRLGDLSNANHLANHVLVSYLNEATFRFLRENGFESFEIDGLAFINADLAVRYLSESMRGDTVAIAVAVDELSKHGCNFFFRITNERTGLVAAQAKMAMLFFNYKERKLGAVPSRFKKAFGKVCFLSQDR